MCRNTDASTDTSTTEENTPPVTEHSPKEILQWEGGGVGQCFGYGPWFTLND